MARPRGRLICFSGARHAATGKSDFERYLITEDHPMQIAELPRLKSLLDLMGLDQGANVVITAVIPSDWEMRARLAEDELLHLRAEQAVDLAMGEESDQRTVATIAPNADEFLNAAFDGGELDNLFYEPWRNIFDAREAEARVKNLAGGDEQEAPTGS
jgi:hypothetical protein